MQQLTDFVTIRTVELNDLKFLVSSSATVLAGCKSTISKGMDFSYAYELYEKLILLAITGIPGKIEYSTFLCCKRENTDEILGYIIADPKENHILSQYTKYMYRNLGIQKHLLMPLVVDPARSVSVNWPTCPMLRLVRAGKVTMQNKILDQMMHWAHYHKDKP